MCSDAEEEPLDPRIHDELETLNQASLLINKLEVEIQDAKYQFNEKLTESSVRLRYLSKRLAIYVEKAQPYYDTRLRIKELSDMCQQSLDHYQSAISNRDTAKEMIMVAHVETSKRKARLSKSESVEGWEKTVEIATEKIIHADCRAAFYEEALEKSAQELDCLEQTVKVQHRNLKKYVEKSRPYFEAKAKYNLDMDEQRHSITKLEDELRGAKCLYDRALKNLERISNDIHDKRSSRAPSKDSEEESDSDRKTEHPKNKVLLRRHSIAARKLSQHQRAGLSTLNPRRQSCIRQISEPVPRKLSLSQPENLDKLTDELVPTKPSLERTISLQVDGEELWGCSLRAESEQDLMSCSSYVIRDEILEESMKDTYFEGSATPTNGFELPVIPPIEAGQEEYEKLPGQLACYQNELNQKRRTTLVADPSLKLSAVTLLLHVHQLTDC